MYAVIKAGGKQHRVKAGDVIEVELVHGDPGDKVEFRPLVVFDDDAKPHYGKEAQRAVVVAKLVGEQKGEKVKVFKYRPKTGYSRRQGHRQLMTLLEIEDVRLESRRAPAKKTESEDEAAPAKAAELKAAEAKSETKAGTRAKPAPKAKADAEAKSEDVEGAKTGAKTDAEETTETPAAPAEEAGE